MEAAGAAGAGEGWVRSVMQGCISKLDMEIERRPYHRNCSCALHNTSEYGLSSKACSRCGKLSFPKPKRCRSMVCLSLMSTHHLSGSQVSSTYLSSSARHGLGGGVPVDSNWDFVD